MLSQVYSWRLVEATWQRRLLLFIGVQSQNQKKGWHKMKVHRPNAQVIPHDIFNFVMPDVDSLAELKVILFIAHQTSGRGKEWDWISESQFRDGITRRDGQVVNRGTGLTTPAIRQGIEKALEHGHILRRFR